MVGINPVRIAIVTELRAKNLHSFPLTPWTKMRRTSRERDSLDERPTAQTVFPGSAIHVELVLHRPLQAGAADVIANARAALLDGARQHGDDGSAQHLGLLRRHCLAEDRRMQPG